MERTLRWAMNLAKCSEAKQGAQAERILATLYNGHAIIVCALFPQQTPQARAPMRLCESLRIRHGQEEPAYRQAGAALQNSKKQRTQYLGAVLLLLGTGERRA